MPLTVNQGDPAARNFAGPSTAKLLQVAHEYAYPVTGYLIGTGQIFRECAAGLPGRRGRTE